MLGSMVGMIGRMVRRTGQSVLGKVLGWVTGHGGTVLLDAATDARAPEVTFSRADQAMVCDEAGNWTWTALPYRRSYDVTTREWGYLFEPQRTNRHIGAASYTVDASTVDGATVEITTEVGPAVQGAPVLKVTTGASDGAFDNGFAWPGNSTAIAAYTPGSAPRLWYQSWGFANNSASVSLFVMAVSSPCQVMCAVGRGSADLALSDKVVVTAEPGVWRRISNSGADGTNDVLRHIVKTAGDIYICCPQLETGSIATSPIATNGAAKTVSADVCTYQNNVLTDAAGAVLLRTAASFSSPETAILGTNANAGNIRVTVAGGLGYWDKTNAVATAAPNGPLNAARTGIVSYGGTQGSAQWSGGDEALGNFDGTMNWTPALSVGSLDGRTRFLNGYINHLSVFPTQLDAATRAEAVQLFN